MDLNKVNQDYTEHTDEQSVILWEKDGEEVRLTVSEFRGNLYLGIRYWIQDIENEWIPTRSGFSIPYNLDSVSRLYSALVKLLSEAEVLQEVIEHSKKAKDE